MRELTFANPSFLYLFILLVPVIAWYLLRQKNTQSTLQISSIRGFSDAPRTYKHLLRHLMFAIRILCISLLILVLARPQSTDRWQNVSTEGIDIILSLDISSSMLAQDFQPNRLEASKDVAIEFISGRPNDRIGLVIFSGESFTQCPLTTDHAVVINLFKDIESGMIEDGTAIGMGLATSINRMKDSDAKSKVVILLTDGVNNRGAIAPVTAAEIARTFGIRVYTIGVGSVGTAPYPVQTPYGIQYQNMEVQIDEKILEEIAVLTDGKYFRATNNQKLVEIYHEIDQLEKTKIDVTEFSRKQEEYLLFALVASVLILTELVIRNTLLRSIP
ncbi:MAG: VWA domain-containing protein [Bacteroidales bacterium]|nr:MAG: VWA domain-containing protein [Bacteroidales bacterium]